MSQCLTADAMLAIGDALEWNVADGLRHLEHCDDCRAQLETMRLTRSALLDAEPVAPEVLARISTAVSGAVAGERIQARRGERWKNALETLMSGIAALVVLVSSEVPVTSVSTAALGFGLGIALMVVGRVLARNVPVLRWIGAGA